MKPSASDDEPADEQYSGIPHELPYLTRCVTPMEIEAEST